MSTVRSFFRSFSGGAVAPEFWGQIADAKFQTGLAECRNFTVLPHGPVENRPGTQFVARTKLSDTGLPVRLVPFEFSREQTLVLEFGPGYIRFITQGAMVEVSAGVPYEVATPYQQAELFDLHYVQSADVLTLVHPNHPPKELRRYGATDWRLVDIVFAPALPAPTSPAAVATTAPSPSNLRTYAYKVTAVASDGDESFASTGVTCDNNLDQTGAYNTINWAGVAGAARYNVYARDNGLYGYIGTTDGSVGATFRDENIAPDLSRTPPSMESPFTPGGGILSVPVTAGGSGYRSALTGGNITAVTVTDAGLFPADSPPTASISDVTGSGATLQVVTREAFTGTHLVAEVRVISGGSGYSNPAVVFSPAGPTAAATATLVVPKDVVLTVTDATGSGAVLTATVVAGAITAVNVINPGKGYTAPTITISDPAGGSGATFGSAVLGVAGDYPGAVSYFEQRRLLAGTLRKPQNFWMTRTGTESNLQASVPTRDDDAISFRIAARQVSRVLHAVPLSTLVLLTGSAEYRVASSDGGPLTPTTVSVVPQSYVGANNVQPALVNNNVLFAAARGGHLRELAYNNDAQGYLTGDLCLRAPHLFDGLQIMDMAYAKAPVPTVWCVGSNGELRGLTYVPEQAVGAWHHHDTGNGDKFLSVCAVTEGDEDVVYVAVARTVGGVLRTYIERFASRAFTDTADAVFVDSSLTYRGSPATTFSGLDYLEGRTVSILADGGEHPQRVVTGGEVELDEAASVVTVGLPIEADVKTLPMVLEGMGAFGQGRPKNANQVVLRVYRSSGMKAGPSFDKLVELKQRSNEPMGTAPDLVTDEVSIALRPTWQNGGQVCVRQAAPLPLTIVAMALEADAAG